MNKDVTYVTQTKYYSPVFNAAIFDGPLRLYFAQHNESDALKVYFDLQERLEAWKDDSREKLRRLGQCIFVMLYPTDETFVLSFENETGVVIQKPLGRDTIIGVRGSVDQTQHNQLIDMIEDLFQKSIADKTNRKFTAGSSPQPEGLQ